MRKIIDYLRLILFMGGVLVGIQVPGFIDQYSKSLEAHSRESTLSLEEFQADANKYFNGDLEKLISHYQSNEDPVFNTGGDSIRAIYSRNLLLGKAVEEFQRTTYSAYIHVFLHPVTQIKNEVWESYSYNILLNESAIISGLSLGVILSAITDLLVLLLISILRTLKRQVQVKVTRN
ncbi:MAG: DUF2937 family protein [Amphritea sp.]